ncbi:MULTISPECIES: shikimate kinase [Prochlorococcus]|uniref:shikimate kinase n=1 Tax=Prochlorococcus TaxID=1218 RepID=UPI00053383C6|nr:MULTISPECIES: shikimate kinase [Prochlorococcus]KGG13267.1 Shikimate kinase I [Prochlorococcus sp. MIT 0601]
MNPLSTPNLSTKELGGRNLYLVGMMGSGKSITGPILASKLSYRFVDVDKVVEELAQKNISDIFNQDGEHAFRDIETQVLKEIGQRHSLVVATGGGIVIKSENWGILHQGVVVWLNPNRSINLTRLNADKPIRPLLKKNLVQDFDDLFNKRKSLYLEADLHVPINQETPDEVADLILEHLESIINEP